MPIAMAAAVTIVRSDSLLTLCLTGIPFRAADGAISIGIESLEHPVAAVVAAVLRPVCPFPAECLSGGVSLGFRHHAIEVRVDPRKMLGHLCLNFCPRVHFGRHRRSRCLWSRARRNLSYRCRRSEQHRATDQEPLHSTASSQKERRSINKLKLYRC
jgi:hypothetical protein